MLDETTTEANEAGGSTAAVNEGDTTAAAPAKKAAARKTAAKKTAAKAPAKKTAAKKATAAKAPAADAGVAAVADEAGAEAAESATAEAPRKAAAKKAPAKKAAAKKTAAKKTTAAKKQADPAAELPLDLTGGGESPATDGADAPAKPARTRRAAAPAAVVFQAPDATTAPPRNRRKPAAAAAPVDADAATDEAVESGESGDAAVAVAEAAEQAEPVRKTAARKKAPAKKSAAKATPAEDEEITEDAEPAAETEPDDTSVEADSDSDEDDNDDNEGTGGTGSAARRRRRRGGRRRRKPGDGSGSAANGSGDDSDAEGTADSTEARGNAGNDNQDESEDSEQGDGTSTRRRRVRVRDGEGRANADDPNTVTRVRPSRTGEDQITAISGSTRLEAKKQRRREGRDAGRRRAPIVSEAEFLARRESVDRVMVIRQREDLTQIAVLEDKVLVEHYVARESQTSLIGNVYVGRVQNVLPSMEAAFIDIGKGRNAVLYAGEVNWSALGHREGQPRKIESVLSSGQSILVQVSKDPIGHKGARLTSQISLAGRFLVYVPDGTTSGISRKLPDTERSRLKTLLKEIVPDTAGVIVRTAAEGASEEELTQDVERLKARWEEIEKQAKTGNAPKLLYGEPDLTLKVVRDLFTEDFTKLVIQGDDAWDTVQQYVAHVAPDLEHRLEKFDSSEGADSFADYRISEQIAKGLDRKVWLPSGGSLIIDRTEAMTVVDVNTGKFTGSGGNLEETVTKNNLEAAEEMVRQLRLRDIGGIIVIDFIDMVLESNRDLVLRRLVECLGRDRTRHQVAEVTSLGLVQMTRKRIGTGLVEAFSENCDHCQGRGLIVHDLPVEPKRSDDSGDRRTGNRRNRGRGQDGEQGGAGESGTKAPTPTPKDIADSHPAPAVSEFPDEVPANVLKARAEAAEKVAEAEQRAADRDAAARERRAPADAPTESTEAGAQVAAEEPSTREGDRPSRNRNRNRNAGQSGRTAEPAAEAPAADRAADQVEEAPADEPVVETPVETPSEAPVETQVEAPAAQAPAPVVTEPVVTAPKVVTRTRRAASRPAGSTAGISLEPVAIVVAAPVAAPPAAPVEPPKVITRTRRAATRPAGAGASQPAAMTIDDVLPSAEAAVEAELAGGQGSGENTAALHVPVKKKGARKH